MTARRSLRYTVTSALFVSILLGASISVIPVASAIGPWTYRVEARNCNWVAIPGAILNSNREYSIRARGQWSVCSASGGDCPNDANGRDINSNSYDANGIPGHTTNGGEYPGRVGTAWAALLIRIGHNGDILAPGTVTELSGVRGQVFARINDGECSDNDGAIELTIAELPRPSSPH